MKTIILFIAFISIYGCEVQNSKNDSKPKKSVRKEATSVESEYCQLISDSVYYLTNDSSMEIELIREGENCGAYFYSINDSLGSKKDELIFGKGNLTNSRVSLGELQPGNHKLYVWDNKGALVRQIEIIIGMGLSNAVYGNIKLLNEPSKDKENKILMFGGGYLTISASCSGCSDFRYSENEVDTYVYKIPKTGKSLTFKLNGTDEHGKTTLISSKTVEI